MPPSRCPRWKKRLRAKVRKFSRHTRSAIRRRTTTLRIFFSLGRSGERAAAQYLEQNFFLVWDRNVRTRLGEIDVVASQCRSLVFVEVKTRRAHTESSFSGRSAVDEDKQRRLKKLAWQYTRENRVLIKQRRTRSIRFDVVEVVVRGLFRRPSIRHHVDAF